jgi:hypothetical protein
MSKTSGENTDDRPSHINQTPSVADVPNSLLPTEDVDESRCNGSQLAAEQFVADGGCDSVEATKKGTIGEWAFCQYLPGNRKPDSGVYPEGDGGWDVNWGGNTWDIKTVGRHIDTPALTVNAMNRLRADRYALVNRVGENTCRIVGYAPRETVKEQQVRLGEYDRAYYHVPRDKLAPFPPVLTE